MELSFAEQEAILSEYTDFIYEHQLEQYQQGLRPEPDLAEIIGDFSDLIREQEEKAQMELNLARLRHLQDQAGSLTFQDEVLKEIKDEVEKEEKGDTFDEWYGGDVYDHERGKDAFGLACDVMDMCRKLGLPHPKKYELMLRIYPYVGVKSDREIIFMMIKELEVEARAYKTNFKNMVFR